MILNQETPQNRSGPRLLVSVRSALEAKIALGGGADVIDVKEPQNGPLGQANPAVIRDVVRVVDGRVPVSAALGELIDHCQNLSETTQLCRDLPDQLWLVKWGLCGNFDWRATLRCVIRETENRDNSPGVVAVAYAEGNAVGAPDVQHVVDFACGRSGSVLLIDTFDKSRGKGLLSWLSKSQLVAVCCQCHAHDVSLALAGSLRLNDVAELRDVRPDWFAVRGAACVGGRDSTISEEKVRRLVDVVHGGVSIGGS